MEKVLGCDISKYQDAVSTPYKPDLSKMKNAGIQFVILRASENLYLDSDFEYYWQECVDHNIPRMVYSFLDYWSENDSTIQAKFLVDWFKSKNIKNIRVWLDFERPSMSFPELPSRQDCLNMIQNWMNVVDAGLGTETGIYLNDSTIKYLSPIPNWLKNRPFWIAWPVSVPSGKDPIEYTRNMNPPTISQFTNLKVWQFAWNGPGLQSGMESKGLDINWFLDDLDGFYDFSGFTESPNEPPIIIPPVESPVLDSGIVTATNGLNVRSSPQISSSNKLYVLRYQSSVNIYEKLSNWYRIDSTKQGWVSSDYIKLVTSLPVLYQAKVNAPIGLRVRSSPETTSNNYLRTLPDKTIVSIYETNGTWGKIDPVKSEWCSLIYLSIIG